MARARGHTRGVEGSNPPLATQEGSCKIIGFTTFFLYNRGRGLYEKYGFEKMSHEMELLNYPLAHGKDLKHQLQVFYSHRFIISSTKVKHF